MRLDSISHVLFSTLNFRLVHHIHPNQNVYWMQSKLVRGELERGKQNGLHPIRVKRSNLLHIPRKASLDQFVFVYDFARISKNKWQINGHIERMDGMRGGRITMVQSTWVHCMDMGARNYFCMPETFVSCSSIIIIAHQFVLLCARPSSSLSLTRIYPSMPKVIDNFFFKPAIPKVFADFFHIFLHDMEPIL